MKMDLKSLKKIDINKPGCPREVIHCNVADAIRDTYARNGMKNEIPEELNSFLEQCPENAGYEWEERVVRGCCDAPAEVVEKWINGGMPSGFFRAQLRSIRNEKMGL